jgi:hypothetical protein
MPAEQRRRQGAGGLLATSPSRCVCAVYVLLQLQAVYIMDDIAAIVKRSWWWPYLFFPPVRSNPHVAEDTSRGKVNNQPCGRCFRIPDHLGVRRNVRGDFVAGQVGEVKQV